MINLYGHLFTTTSYFSESDDRVFSKMLHENQMGRWDIDDIDIREEMNVVAGVVYKVELEVLQGGFESQDANISSKTFNK